MNLEFSAITDFLYISTISNSSGLEMLKERFETLELIIVNLISVLITAKLLNVAVTLTK